MKDFNLHDATLVNVVINPLCKSCQLLIAVELDKVISVEIDEIQKIIQPSIECLSMFFNGEGNIDYSSYENKKDYSVLTMRGLINPYNSSFQKTSWEFIIYARKFVFSEKHCSEHKIDKLISKKKFNLFS